jgi:NADH:ubiquinone oxidoreductase subunit 3 (subunit A)
VKNLGTSKLVVAEFIAVLIIAIVVLAEFLGVETIGQLLPQEAKDSFETLSLDLGTVEFSVNQGTFTVIAIFGALIFLYFGIIREMLIKKKGKKK